ncbi:phage holin family protein [Sphingomonas sp. AX6]|uniref:phage holin family protein n=1 Tax=Sphingomonas sp. AX6 TaxID=2653171 RepID=UPI00135CA3B1|nr:phage holin family protein [Sphingomonas sp. AX6]
MIDKPDEKAGIGTLIGRLVKDGKGYARAEICYAKALAGERMRAAKSGIVFLVAGLVLLHGALIALFVGLVLSLATWVGPFWSMLIVVAVASIIGGVLAKIGLAHFQRAKTGPDLPSVEVVEP